MGHFHMANMTLNLLLKYVFLCLTNVTKDDISTQLNLGYIVK
jgi:hypothetical protein